MSLGIVLLALLAYALSILLLALINRNIFESFLISSVIMIIVISYSTYYFYAVMENERPYNAEMLGTIEFTKKDPSPSETPANTQQKQEQESQK
jgi:ABC-type multidrug transport system permease subunit